MLAWLDSRSMVRILMKIRFILLQIIHGRVTIEDKQLLQEKIEQVDPCNIFIQIGGGVQERLGLFLAVKS